MKDFIKRIGKGIKRVGKKLSKFMGRLSKKWEDVGLGGQLVLTYLFPWASKKIWSGATKAAGMEDAPFSVEKLGEVGEVLRKDPSPWRKTAGGMLGTLHWLIKAPGRAWQFITDKINFGLDKAEKMTDSELKQIHGFDFAQLSDEEMDYVSKATPKDVDYIQEHGFDTWIAQNFPLHGDMLTPKQIKAQQQMDRQTEGWSGAFDPTYYERQAETEAQESKKIPHVPTETDDDNTIASLTEEDNKGFWGGLLDRTEQLVAINQFAAAFNQSTPISGPIGSGRSINLQMAQSRWGGNELAGSIFGQRVARDQGFRYNDFNDPTFGDAYWKTRYRSQYDIVGAPTSYLGILT
tara:strand:+ start:164 stop:1210 length:1047 start_codon:yes stop_codon:yes gene_type:complete